MDKIEILSIDFHCSICAAEKRNDFHCIFLMQAGRRAGGQEDDKNGQDWNSKY